MMPSELPTAPEPDSLAALPVLATAATQSIVWTDPLRSEAFSSWLQRVARQHQLDQASVRLASADASFRRYFRIDSLASSHSTASCIIMDAPPALEDCSAFAHVAGLMAAAGLRVPEILDWSQSEGFLLLSDLGNQTVLQALAPAGGLPSAPGQLLEPTQRCHDFFMQAVDALVAWQCASRPGVLPPYDDTLLTRELALFPDWYVAQHKKFTFDANQQQTLARMFADIKTHNLQALGGAGVSHVYVHRDFMLRNLMVPAQADAALGVLDFQDAVYGPISYDIASLLRDAFVSWDEEFVIDITVRYWQKARRAGLPVGDDFGAFYAAVEWMGLQRHLKILGIFARLTLRDGKPAYLADTPRFVRYARHTAARYRPLGPLLVLLDAIEGNETRIGYTF